MILFNVRKLDVVVLFLFLKDSTNGLCNLIIAVILFNVRTVNVVAVISIALGF